MAKKIGSPCLNCKDRCVEPVNCHTYCERYKNFVSDRKAIIDEKSRDLSIECYVTKSVRRIKKKTDFDKKR